MKVSDRQVKLWSALALAGVLLAGCASQPSEPPVDEQSSGAPTSDESTDDGADAPAPENGLTCDWENPALVVEADPLTPTGQEGELADSLVGAWQEVGYDSGEGYKTFLGLGDYRFFFSSELDMLYCQNTPKTDHGERSGVVAIEGDVIVFPEATFTALTWGENAMTWINDLDGGTIYLQRR